MTHTLIHEEIADGKFAGGKKIVTLDSVDKVLKYYEDTLKKPLAQRVKQQRVESLRLFDQLRRELDQGDTTKSVDADKILSPERTAEFKKLYSTPDDQKVLKISWPNIWKVYLYEHVNYGGRRYTLNCGWTDFPYDTSLVDNNFNDIGSSVDTGKLVLVTICAQHTWFRGNWWWFFTDDKDFTNNGCNDRISSIAATAVSIPSLVQLLCMLAG